jgi:hypothetical protein
MVDVVSNNSFGPEAGINYTSFVLGRTSLSGKMVPRVDLVPGAFISYDPEGEVSGDFTSSEGDLLSLSYRVNKPVRWIALHFVMGDVDFSGCDLLGIVVKSQAPTATTYRVCVRSGTEEGFEDCFFSKHVVGFSEKSTHIDLIRLDKSEGIVPLRAPWREIILFFKAVDQDLTINDFKVFAV